MSGTPKKSSIPGVGDVANTMKLANDPTLFQSAAGDVSSAASDVLASSIPGLGKSPSVTKDIVSPPAPEAMKVIPSTQQFQTLAQNMDMSATAAGAVRNANRADMLNDSRLLSPRTKQAARVLLG